METLLDSLENESEPIVRAVLGHWLFGFITLTRRQWPNGTVSRASRHVPPPHEAVNDAMETLLDSLENEPEPIVRAVLGHWLFGFIHPYTDGNGRMARFLMNVMMASGGYPWTIVRTARRKQYLAVLDAASVGQDILPFANFIREEMNVDWSREPARG